MAAAPNGNVVLAPLAVSETMGVLYLGARGQTAEQMAAALQFVDEQGATAAAATVAVAGVKGIEGDGPLVFTADRPFIFEILDRRTGSTLFLGRLANPGPRE
jgi:serine protease inhibitor